LRESLERISKLARPFPPEATPADEGTAEREKGLVDIRTALVADGETPEAMQPRERAFDHPPTHAQATPVRCASFGEDRDDAARPETVAMGLGIVAAIALERVGPLTRPAAPAANRG
jgi:hypothetical protein